MKCSWFWSLPAVAYSESFSSCLHHTLKHPHPHTHLYLHSHTLVHSYTHTVTLTKRKGGREMQFERTKLCLCLNYTPAWQLALQHSASSTTHPVFLDYQVMCLKKVQLTYRRPILQPTIVVSMVAMRLMMEGERERKDWFTCATVVCERKRKRDA